MKTKCIVFEREDGSKFALPLIKVAEKRAKYYAEKDKDTTFESEVEFVMNDSFEGIDWFRNQQDPDDFKNDIIQISDMSELSLNELINNSSADIEEVELPYRGPPSPAEIQDAQLAIADAYLEAQLQVLHMLGHGELNYVKTAVNMPEGGKYLLQFSHVDGPKTDVQELFKRRAEAMKK